MFKKSFIFKSLTAIIVLAVAILVVPVLIDGRARTITKHSAELESLLAEMPWVSPGLSETRALYEITFRTCPACIGYHKSEFPKLQTMGVDTRLFVFARNGRTTPADERSVVAELYKTRSWDLAQDWYASASPKRYYAKMDNIANADADEVRTALVEKGQAQTLKLYQILQENGLKNATPALLWKNKKGEWRAIVGNNPITNAQIRKELK